MAFLHHENADSRSRGYKCEGFNFVFHNMIQYNEISTPALL
jgi:hypothetical protein